MWSRISAGALLLRPCRCAREATGGSERARGAPQVARNPLVVAGRPLRVSRAPAPAPAPAHGVEGAPGGDAYEHPKVREARMAARALADRLGGRRLPGMDCGPPPERELVCYSDL